MAGLHGTPTRAGRAPGEPPAPPRRAPGLDLSLLVFNVEYGGSRATDAVMADLDADVVGVLESYNRLPEIAAAAGYPYYDVGLQILSKYPILEPSGADGLYSYIEVRPGEAVAMINTHLDYVQDGPNRLERGRAGRRRAGHRGGGPALVGREAAPLGRPPAGRGLAGAVHR